MSKKPGMRETLFGAVSISSLAILQSVPAWAQDDDVARLDTIIVTGTKQDLSLQDVEVSVDIFNEERLEEENLFDLDDVLNRVPNVTTSTTTATLSIRGISRFGVGNAGQGVTSNVYLDGAPIATQALGSGFDSVWDVGQVEILRGPQSTVQGRNALAGAVVLRTNDPTYDWEYKFRARYGNADTQQYAGVISGPIIDHQVAFRLAADYQSTDGFTTNAFSQDDDAPRDNILIRGKLLLEPNALPDLRAELIVDYNDANSERLSNSIAPIVNIASPEVLDFDFDSRVNFFTPIRNENETIRFLADISYDLSSNFTLKALGTFERNENFISGGDPENPGMFVESPVSEDFANTTDIDTYSAELRLEYDFGKLTGSVGGYYFDDDERLDSVSASLLRDAAPFPLDPDDTLVNTGSFTETTTQNFAFYTQARYDINDRWTADFAIRYDNEQFATTGTVAENPTVSPASCTIEVPPPFLVILGLPIEPVSTCVDIVQAFAGDSEPPPLQETTFDAFLPRGVLTYNVTDDLSVFVSAQRGYRAGGTFTFLAASDGTSVGTSIQLGSFDPEFLTTYEVGFRSEWLNNRLTLNGNFFLNFLDDQQLTVAGPTGTEFDTQTINAGESRIFGAEFTFDFDVSDSIDVYGSLGLLDTEFTDFPFAQSGPFENLDGNEFPVAPNVSFTLGASYEHRSGFFSSGSLSFQGPQESQIFNLDADDIFPISFAADPDSVPGGLPSPDVLDSLLTEEVGSRLIANVRAGYTYENFSIAVFASNLFDDQTGIFRIRGLVNQDTGMLGPSAVASEIRPDPRTYGIVLDVAF